MNETNVPGVTVGVAVADDDKVGNGVFEALAVAGGDAVGGQQSA